jgi:hypothetical protein
MPDSSEELERRAEEANVAYERNTALRTLVVAIPGIGSIFDMVLASEGQRIYRERIHRLIADMKVDMQERMETVENSALDKEYLESEEFFDLLIKALDATIKTRDEMKRRMYARILTESTILSEREGHSPEEYLNLIADLTPLELRVARALYTDWTREEWYESRGTKEIQEAWRGWQERMRAEVNIDGADFQLILGRLHSSGLITEEGALFPRSAGPIDEPPQYWVSLGFEKLMRFLERRGQTLDSR